MPRGTRRRAAGRRSELRVRGVAFFERQREGDRADEQRRAVGKPRAGVGKAGQRVFDPDGPRGRGESGDCGGRVVEECWIVRAQPVVAEDDVRVAVHVHSHRSRVLVEAKLS